MGVANPPNNDRRAPGHSSTPAPTIAGRGAMPSGDRFHLPAPPASQFPPAPITNVGPTMVPIYPPGSDRHEVSIPDMAGIARRPK